MLPPFRLHEPRTVAEASALLRERGPEAAIYAGGTELLVLMKERLVEPTDLVNIKTIPGLDRIRLDADGSLLIGALATHRAIERSPLVRERAQVLADLAANVANVRVRNAGTLGGNLCFAEPHSDPATLLVAWDAVLTLAGDDGSRELPAERFFVGLLETARAPHELLVDVRIPPLPAGVGAAYERFKTHERPSASVAAVVRLADGAVSDARIVVGGVAARPTRMSAAESTLGGERPTPELLGAAAERVRAEVEPTEDPFESTDYKRHLAAVLTRKALAVAVERAGVEGTRDEA